MHAVKSFAPYRLCGPWPLEDIPAAAESVANDPQLEDLIRRYMTGEIGSQDAVVMLELMCEAAHKQIRNAEKEVARLGDDDGFEEHA